MKGGLDLVFSSLTFLFLFFIANILTQITVPVFRKRNIALLSLFLIFCFWDGLPLLLLVPLLVLVFWFCGLQIRRQQQRNGRMLWLGICQILMLVLLCLFVFKGFFLKTSLPMPSIPGALRLIVMVLSGCFYATLLQYYLFDVALGKRQAERSYWRLLLEDLMLYRASDADGDCFRQAEEMNHLSSRPGASPEALVRRKNIIMLCFSLVFYAWAGIRYVPLLLGMTFICWFFARRIDSAKQHGRNPKPDLVLCVVLVLLILGIFKYTGFFLRNVQLITGLPKVIPNIVLPIGISFYTFQLLSYVVDVYRGDAEVQPKYWLLLLYASLFHQCIAGPIVRYRDVAEDIRTRRIRLEEVSRGVTRFAVGLAKKAVLANGCAALFNQALGISTDAELTAAVLRNTSVMGLWLGMLAFTLQIYLDFSAYSDMAIGMGLMCGFHYKENFNYPYTADSVTDFWRRWHISLSTFFRDYVYIPLGGNRCSKARHIFNLFVVWGLTGMWHGAHWNYIFWGLYYFLFLLLEKYVIKVDRIFKPLRHLLTMLIVLFGWALFKFEDLSLLGAALKGMFGLNHNAFSNITSKLAFQNNLFFLVLAIVASLPLAKNLAGLAGNVRMNLMHRERQTGVSRLICSPVWLHVKSACEAALPVVLVFLSAMALAGNSYNPFLYFQF